MAFQLSTAVGQPLSRVDGFTKVTGTATFTAEVAVPGLVHAALITSTSSAGRVVSIDIPANLPGLITDISHASFPRLKPAPVALQAGVSNRMAGSAGQQLLPMQDDRVYYAGQPVAVVVAETSQQAEFAASRIRVGYAQDPAKIDFAAERVHALKPADVWGDETDYERGDIAAAERAAAVTIRQTYETALQHHVTMEPHATTANWDGEHLTLYEPSTWVYGIQKTVATWFDLPLDRVRVIQHNVGGSFGSKGPTWPHVAIATAAAKVAGRPVRLVLTRRQTFVSNGYRPKLLHAVSLSGDDTGRLLGVGYETTAQTSMFDDRVVAPTTRTPRRLYAVPNFSTTYRLVRLNRNGPFTMRGPGEAPGLFAIESAMDELAYATNTDPLELRIRNHADRDPENGQAWSSKHLLECYRQGAQRFGWSRRVPDVRATRDDRHFVGVGMATMMYDARSSPTKATATMGPDGDVVVRTATCDPGTGSRTILVQMAAGILGLPASRLRLELGDTDLPVAPIAAGSQTTASVGTAVTRAAEDLKRKLAARPIGQSEVVGHGEAKKIGETEGVSRYSFGAHFAEVRVDSDTGEVGVSRYTAAFAAGRIMNPKLARSQLLGGIVMGIGMALMEQTRVDPTTGRYVNDDLAEYHVPSHADITPNMDVFFVDENDDEQVNPIGVKGVGEIGTVGAAAAIANAVYHATGKRVRDLPITPDKLL